MKDQKIELPDVPFIFQYGQYNEDDLRQPGYRLIPYRDFQEIMQAYARSAIEADRKKFGRNDNDRGNENDQRNDNDNRNRRGSIVNNASASSEPVAYIRTISFENGEVQRDLVWASAAGDLSRYMDFVSFEPLCLPIAPQPTEPSGHSIQDCPEDDKWNCKYCLRVNTCPVQGLRDEQPAEPVAWPTHEFAIVIDRFYEGEGPSLAMWNGESYQFSDGDHDLYRGEDGSLGGYTAEWLTHRELERRLFCSQQIVKIPYWFSAPVTQEPVAFLCRECDEEGWSTYAVMPHEVPSAGEFLHVEPLYASPVAAPVAAQAQPDISGYTCTVPDDCETLHWRGQILSMNELATISAEPVLDKYQPCGCVICTCEDDVQCQGCGARHCGRHPIGAPSDPVYVSAAPVKVDAEASVPSDTDIDELSREWGLQSAAYPSKSMVRDFSRALLARYK